MRTDDGKPVLLADYRPTDYAIPRVRLTFSLAPSDTIVRAELDIARREGAAPGTRLVLDGDGLQFLAAELDGIALPADAYVATPDSFRLLSPPQRPFRLTLTTRIDPDANTRLMGLYRSRGTYCTQCEAEGFRRITYFLDRPDVLSVYTTRIEAPRDVPILLSNGNLVDSGAISGTGGHYAVWEDPFPKPSYLFALVAGDLACVKDTFTTASGRIVDLRIYVEHGKEDRCDWAMQSLKRAMRWDEERFGREYDLDIFMVVAVSDFNMGAMENKGLNIFNDKYVLAEPEAATDQDYASIEGVIAHEYFHNWTGNRITCRDWFQLCLKEGLTVYRDQEFTSDVRSRAVKRITDVRVLKSHQFPEDAGPLAHPVRPDSYREINNFYTATVYEKGAEIVRMIEALVGRDGFRRGMDLYFERHDGEAATVEQFVRCFEDACAIDLQIFMRWYSQAGTPRVTARGSWDEAARTYTLDVEQVTPPTPGQPVKQPLVIPVRFGLIGGNGDELAYESVSGAEVTGDLIRLTEPSHRIVFTGLAQRPIPSLLRGFSAPVKLTTDLSPSDELFLLAHDRDPFNAWQAAQSVAMRLLVEGVRAIRSGGEPPYDRRFAAALQSVAADGRLDTAFRALVVTLPTEADVAREFGEDVDPDAIHRSRRALRTHVGVDLFQTLSDLYPTLASDAPFSPDAASAGRRALRNAALDLMAASGRPEGAEKVSAAYRDANNMTERFAALSTMVNLGLPAAEAALADFERRHGGDPLVMDKWFTVQATAPRPEALDNVKRLMAHPAFSMATPNRVRALIGAFATMNQSQFNRPDGAGYDFVVDRVLDLDRTNPQIAARLLAAFRSWRALEPGRRAKAEAALRRVAETAGLSRDVADIAERSLA